MIIGLVMAIAIGLVGIGYNAVTPLDGVAGEGGNSERIFLALSSALFHPLFGGFVLAAVLAACNETANLVSVALGYRAERGWMSEGWWQTPPGDCRVLYQGDLQSRFYYLHAVVR